MLTTASTVNISTTGYLRITVYKNGERKSILSHRFIYECYNGLISEGLVIDHINRDKLDNRIENLHVVTHRENNLNSAPRIKLQQRRPVIGVMDLDGINKEELSFSSMNSASKYYDINDRSIKKVVDGIYRSAHSKKFNKKVFFKYNN